MKRTLIAFLSIFFFNMLSAQNIQMNFPYFKGSTYDFVIFQGKNSQTISQGVIPENGKFTLVVPKEYAPYKGMARWQITNSKDGGGIHFVMSGKDFSISCDSPTPNEENIVYTDKNQFQVFNQLYKQQEAIIQRYRAMAAATSTFSPKGKNYPVFEKELRAQAEDFYLFNNKLNANNDYACQFLQFVNITQGIGSKLTYKEEEEKAKDISEFVVNKLDWKTLYTSGKWLEVISTWTAIHTNVIKDPYLFAQNFDTIGKKISDKTQYADFTERVTYYLTQQGKDDYINAISQSVISSNKISQYEGVLSAYTKGVVGSQAPDLIFTEHIGNVTDHNHKTTVMKSNELTEKKEGKTLLVFYESGCGPCANLLLQLPGNYEYLQSKNIKIVSISADSDEEAFKNKAKDFVWADYYCDFDGMQGVNFKNYGVSGTPTMFLLDKNGKILLRTAELADILGFKK